MKIPDRYLLARYLQKPRDPKQTNQAGYMLDQRNVRYDEDVVFSVGLKSKDQVEYQIILNIDQQQVVKNNIGENQDWNSIWGYFSSHYGGEIVRYLNRTNHVRKQEKK